ncbi:MAG: polyprenyl synthetase family protein [Candidatus Omnitrophota bacterium]
MLNEIKNKIDKELKILSKNIDRIYSLNKISPLLSRNIKEFILRDGKRARPILFIIGYLGFSKKPASGLFKSALSIELLHDFMLIHDDIIDKSDTRRGKPSMHKIFNTHLEKFKNIKFNGQDLSIVAGDVLYAIAIDTFISIKENPSRKEKALKKFIEAAIYTGSGEFIELLYGTKNIDEITKEDIYKIYTYKTAHYTFACPLSIGAILAGTGQFQIDLICKYGSCLGKAFQIKDDILGMFAQESETGKSPLVDLQEAKKTILVWYAYKHSNSKNKKIIKNIFSKEKITALDLSKMREIITHSGALKFAETEIISLTNKALAMINSSRMKKAYKDFLYAYSKKILD